MEIHWISPAPNIFQCIQIEYAIQLQVRLLLIREAEHLMDYLSLISVEVFGRQGTLAIGRETPEPLFSLLAGNLPQIDPFPVGEDRMDNHSFGILFGSFEPWSLEPA